MQVAEKNVRGSVLVQVRMPSEVVVEIDSLITRDLFQSRADFILESARILLSRYFPENPVKLAMAAAFSRRFTKQPYKRILSQNDREELQNFYRGRDPLELSRWARERL